MADDIVTRLRAVLHNDRSVELMNREAADEIEVLRSIVTACRIEIERLTAERDEVRREVCNLRPSVCLGAQTAVEFAKHRDWDCFKEDKP